MPLTPDRRRALSEALITLAGLAGPAERARVLAEVAVTLYRTGAEVVLVAQDDHPGRGPAIEALDGSDGGCLELAELELRTESGPALDCLRSGRTGRADLYGESAHPTWTRRAIALGWDAACALPLSVGGPPLGAWVLLGRSGRPLPTDPADVAWAQTVASVAAAGLVHHRALAVERRLSGQLRQALESRVVVEQAKGVLAERGGIDPTTAFDRMRRYARHCRRTLRDVATDVVLGTAADAVLTWTSDPPRD